MTSPENDAKIFAKHFDILRNDEMSNEINQLTIISKALADPKRIRIILALSQRECCLCQLTELLQLSPSTVSKHLSILRQADLIRSRREGKWIHCSLPGEEASPASREALAWVISFAGESEQARKDARRLKEICSRPGACEKQRETNIKPSSIQSAPKR